MRRSQSAEPSLSWTSTVLHIRNSVYAEFWVAHAYAIKDGKQVPIDVQLAVYIDEDGTEFSLFKARILKPDTGDLYKVSLPAPQVPYTIRAYANNIEVKENDILLFRDSSFAAQAMSTS